MVADIDFPLSFTRSRSRSNSELVTKTTTRCGRTVSDEPGGLPRGFFVGFVFRPRIRYQPGLLDMPGNIGDAI